MSDIRTQIAEAIPSLRRYAWALARSRDRADDLVQDCLLRALSARDSFQPGTNLNAWLFTILRNCFLNDVRRDGRRRAWEAEEDRSEFGRAIDSPQVDQIALTELSLHIRQLPAGMREALMLVTIEGMSYEQAAEVMGVPVGTVRSRLSRARRSLLTMQAGFELPEPAPERERELLPA